MERRIAEFWQRIDAMRPSDPLAAVDLGQWAMNVIERDPSARIGVADFRGSTAQMQAAIDRAGGSGALAAPNPDVERRIAEFWARVDSKQSKDVLSAADLGQWALNVTQRNPDARIIVADFRVATAGMQQAIDRAGRGCESVQSTSVPGRIAMVAAPGFIYLDVGPSVQPLHVATMCDGVGRVHRFLEQVLGGDFVQRAAIVTQLRAVSGQLPGFTICCQAPYRSFTPRYVDSAVAIVADDTGWTTTVRRGWTVYAAQQHTVTHEYAHLWQEWGGCGADAGRRGQLGGVWMREGMADWVAYETLAKDGVITRAQADDFMDPSWQDTLRLVTIEDASAYPPSAYGYQVGYQAVRFLIERYGGTAAIRSYCMAMGRGLQWRDAFAQTFGIATTDFYPIFERWRSGGFK